MLCNLHAVTLPVWCEIRIARQIPINWLWLVSDELDPPRNYNKNKKNKTHGDVTSSRILAPLYNEKVKSDDYLCKWAHCAQNAILNQAVAIVGTIKIVG